MKFTVTWDPQAEAELMQLWLSGKDRQAITDAANTIDRLLAYDPDQQGVDFYGDRLLVVPPLSVTYTVSHADRRVVIRQVWAP